MYRFAPHSTATAPFNSGMAAGINDGDPQTLRSHLEEVWQAFGSGAAADLASLGDSRGNATSCLVGLSQTVSETNLDQNLQAIARITGWPMYIAVTQICKVYEAMAAASDIKELSGSKVNLVYMLLCVHIMGLPARGRD